ncbi:MAG: PhoX family phosphatase [Proteobacteria bacterium]|nr:PhoX family phosphatase [Pseudomonadota bacterium]
MTADDDDLPIERPLGEPFSEILARRLGRRAALAGIAGAGMSAAVPGWLAAAGKNPSSLTFEQPSHIIENTDAIAAGYRADVLIRWGDPVLIGAPVFDPNNLNAAAQSKQFGYNNDFLAYLPLPGAGADTASTRGLLCVNHEYTNSELMWAGVSGKPKSEVMTAERIRTEMAAHGLSIIEIAKSAGRWQVVSDSKYPRRITTLATPIGISGPAAGTARMRTATDPSGTRVIGTVNNCAGGVTPWGTVLTAEENFHGYFSGDPVLTSEARNHARLGINGRPWYNWADADERFDVEKHPNEPNRFGWMVEIDPFDPTSTPVKRTALGRFKHEGAGVTLSAERRAVVYMGDDQAFEYLYRFVSQVRVPESGKPAADLLDHGTLSVARFDDDGALRWLPLRFGEGPLTAANGFTSAADVMIEARRAADLLGATPLDRPEDVEVNPVNGKIYVMLTNNKSRGTDKKDAANPRGPNPNGHILELTPKGGDHGASSANWNVFLLAGDLSKDAGARYHPELAQHGAWLAGPDNAAVDPKGRLWIATDQGSAQRKNKIPDGIYAADVDGAGRALTRLFYRCPRDAEMCGPAFTPDGKTLFVAVQHPGEGKGSNFETPSTRWPDFKAGPPPRPAVVAITKSDGGAIGS